MTRNPIPLLLLSLVTLWPGAARAMLVTWELEGMINSVRPDPPIIVGPDGPVRAEPTEVIAQLEAIGIAPEAPWRARLVFDSDTAAEPCGGCDDSREFLGATKSIDFAAGGLFAATPDGVEGSASSVWFMSAHPGAERAIAYLTFRAPLATGSNELVADSMFFAFVGGHPGGVFSASLPVEPPDLGDVSYVDVVLFGRGFGPGGDEQRFWIQMGVTSVAPVPEPALGAFLLVAAAAAYARRRRR